ncbi:MAG: branched-chain-amino-acid transaminase [Bacteriovoracaceae bacterium]|nr:branched-chain-amino-acid transaminase [Bacteriovoracaceae bacterium]
MLININGVITGKEDAKVSVFDRGFLFGDSIYEVTLTYDYVLFKLEEHFDRLWESAESLALHISHSRKELTYEVNKTLKQLNEKRAYVRIIITRGEGMIGLDPNLASKNNVIIICKSLPENPNWWYETGVEMIIANILRNPKESMDPSIKSGNYLNNVLAYAEAKKQGAFDAIMLNRDGFITEGTTNNIWMIKNKEIITPPLGAGLLPGITRQTLIELAKLKNLPVSEKNFTRDELYSADESFLTSSTKELVPIVKINGKSIGSAVPGPLTRKLHQIYKDHVQECVKQGKNKLFFTIFPSDSD